MVKLNKSYLYLHQIELDELINMMYFVFHVNLYISRVIDENILRCECILIFHDLLKSSIEYSILTQNQKIHYKNLQDKWDAGMKKYDILLSSYEKQIFWFSSRFNK